MLDLGLGKGWVLNLGLGFRVRCDVGLGIWWVLDLELGFRMGFDVGLGYSG